MTQEEFDKRFWEYKEKLDLKTDRFVLKVVCIGCGILLGLPIGIWIANYR